MNTLDDIEFHVSKAKLFLRSIERLPQQDKAIRIHRFLKHPGLDCGDTTCKYPEDPIRKFAISKAKKITNG